MSFTKEEKEADKKHALDLASRYDALEGLTFTEARGAAQNDQSKIAEELIGLLEKHGGAYTGPVTAKCLASQIGDLIDRST